VNFLPKCFQGDQQEMWQQGKCSWMSCPSLKNGSVSSQTSL